MAAGTTIKLKGKSGAFAGGDLAAREIGIDTGTGDLYVSTDGSTVKQFDQSAIGTGGSSQWVLLGSDSTAATALQKVDNVVTSDYDLYMIVFDRIAPATDNVYFEIVLRSATPGNIGGTYKTGGNYAAITTTGSGALVNQTGTNGFSVTTIGNAANEWASGWAMINLRTNSSVKDMWGHGVFVNNAGNAFHFPFAFRNTDTTAVAGFGVLFSSGNVASGCLRVYGLKNT